PERLSRGRRESAPAPARRPPRRYRGAAASSRRERRCVESSPSSASASIIFCRRGRESNDEMQVDRQRGAPGRERSCSPQRDGGREGAQEGGQVREGQGQEEVLQAPQGR